MHKDMTNRKLLASIKNFQVLTLLSLIVFPITSHASFIESSMGAAVLNDATAVFYNPAALVLLKNPQVIGQNSYGIIRSEFTGQFTQAKTGFSQSGSSITQSHYDLPSFYFAMPAADSITVGVAVISNFLNKDLEGNSLLRYVQSDNSIENIDFVPAIAFKLNDIFSVGAGINLSYADFEMSPISGFPSLNIPDSQSHNDADGTGIGGDVGLLLKPSKSTLIGLNYRSEITYRLSGKSVFGNNTVISDNYGFSFWTPARAVLSISQFLTPTFGVIGTVQRIEWSIFDNINIHGIATQIGPQSVIVDATVPYHLHDTWLLTLGSIYRVTPKWVVRIAGSYNQSASDGNFQISNGDSTILGISMGYKIFKNVIIDGSYAHAFVANQPINIVTANNKINGITNGSVNSFSLKLTFNL